MSLFTMGCSSMNARHVMSALGELEGARIHFWMSILSYGENHEPPLVHTYICKDSNGILTSPPTSPRSRKASYDPRFL